MQHRDSVAPSSADRLRARLAATPIPHWRTLVPAAAALLLVFGFIVLAQEVFEGETRGFDEGLLLALRTPGDPARPIGPGWLPEVMRDITALGGTAVLTLIVAGLSGFLAITGRRRTALLVLGAVLSGVLVSTLFKHGFARPRPDLVPHGTRVTSASFPSGHAMMSALVYLTLGAMLAGTETTRRARVYVLACTSALALVIGVSRVYLGVHWPTDVIAGWTLGALWAIGASLVLHHAQTSGQVEPLASAGDDDLQGLS